MKNNDPRNSISPFSDHTETGEIERELGAGEKLLWSGRPAPAEWKRDAAKGWNYKFGTTAFSLFWIWLAVQGALKSLSYGQTPTLEELAFPLFGIAFFGGIVWHEWLKPSRLEGEAKRTFYAVTNRRALIVVAGNTREVRSYAPHQIQLGRRERANGTGDVLFNDARSYERERPIRSFQLHKTEKDEAELERETGFFAIENPRQVEQIIRQKLLDTNRDSR